MKSSIKSPPRHNWTISSSAQLLHLWHSELQWRDERHGRRPVPAHLHQPRFDCHDPLARRGCAGIPRLDFTDVEPDSWYASAVRWAASEGIVNGYNESTFGPNDSVTREQLATILCRYAKSSGQDVDKYASLSVYADSGKISDWAKSSLRWAIASGIIHGMEDNVLSPDTDATRAQVATMLMRYETLT